MSGLPDVYFEDESVDSGLRMFKRVLSTPPVDLEWKKSIPSLLRFIDMIREYPAAFSGLCSVTISQHGDYFKSKLSELGENFSQTNVSTLWSILYRVALEYDLSTSGKVSDTIIDFMRISEDQEISGVPIPVQEHVSIARQQLPIALFKKCFSDPRIDNITMLPSAVQNFSDKIDIWKKELEIKEKKIDALKESLDLLKTDFNFVALKAGFQDMLGKKKKEAKRFFYALCIFGVLMLCPVIVELYALHGLEKDWDKVNQVWLAVTAVLSLSLSMFLIFFFRISLRNFDLCNSQIMQIELRMTLCQFIQDYAEYAEDIKKKSADTLSRFESVVFSPISSSDVINLSVVDGLEQIANFVKAARESKA
jgi:hypothetical protein